MLYLLTSFQKEEAQRTFECHVQNCSKTSNNEPFKILGLKTKDMVSITKQKNILKTSIS